VVSGQLLQTGGRRHRDGGRAARGERSGQVGDAGVRLLGALWLAAAVAFWTAAGGALAGRPWWAGLATGTALASIAPCVLGGPTAWIGVPVNLANPIALALAPRFGLG
jgi:hypothetical protein